MLQLLKNQTAGTLTHDETITAGAERTTGFLWLIIAGRQGLHGIESTNTRLADCSLSTTSQDGVGLAQTNQVEGVCQRVA